MPNQKSVAVCAAAALTMSLLAMDSSVAGTQKNTTGLPTYPNDGGGRMDSGVRSLPNGQNCTHYAGSTADPLAAVIAWYKKALPGARVEDVNKDSLYGNYFKLDGIKLLVGNDIVNVYRLSTSKETSIEIFKC